MKKKIAVLLLGILAHRSRQWRSWQARLVFPDPRPERANFFSIGEIQAAERIRISCYHGMRRGHPSRSRPVRGRALVV
jgi:hypothetical protein